MQSNNKKNRKNRVNPLLLVLLTALVIIAVAGIVLFSVGYRYINMSGIRYTGFVKNGQPENGTIKYTDGVS